LSPTNRFKSSDLVICAFKKYPMPKHGAYDINLGNAPSMILKRLFFKTKFLFEMLVFLLKWVVLWRIFMHFRFEQKVGNGPSTKITDVRHLWSTLHSMDLLADV